MMQIEQKIKMLPPELQHEVEDFIEFLIDTNIWLERLLEQERSDEVGGFLDRIPSNHLFITDFSFHSIGVIMGRLNRMNVYLNYIKDAFFYGSVTIIRLDGDFDSTDLGRKMPGGIS